MTNENYINEMIDKLEFGFDDQLFKFINGWNMKDVKTTVIKYFDTQTVLLQEGHPTKTYKSFKDAMLSCFSKTNDYYRNIEITLWNDQVIPLHHLNFVKKDQIHDFIKYKTEA